VLASGQDGKRHLNITLTSLGRVNFREPLEMMYVFPQSRHISAQLALLSAMGLEGAAAADLKSSCRGNDALHHELKPGTGVAGHCGIR
jgi:hypothetical protein